MAGIAFCACFVGLILTLSAIGVYAADSCTWSQQPDGTLFGVCVRDNGALYCQSCTAGNVCKVVPCR